MIEWVTSAIEAVGYPGIFGLMVLEIFVPVVQSEIVMTFSGFVSSRGELNLVAVLVTGVVGSQVGSMALYGLARNLDEDGVNDVVSRYGGWLGLDREDLESAQDLFRRHDRWAVLVGRFIPGLRGYIAIPAGIQKMHVGRFTISILVGTACWVGVLTLAGAWLGDRWRRVEQYSSYVSYGLLGLLVAFVLYRLAVVVRTRAVAD